jgi:hypothetical protein
MDRTPPESVRRALRREVGFGCPVAGCANPYLEYHHFDPPWRERPHHDAAGMVALCAEHHRKADVGAFTDAQLRDLKRPVAGRVAARGCWWNFYCDTPVIFSFRGEPAIWFDRDEDGHLLLNIRMVTSSGEPRLRLDRNDWIIHGAPIDFQSPPSGKRILAKYQNGDTLAVEFVELLTAEAAMRRYPHSIAVPWATLAFPMTAVEVEELIGGSDLGFGPKWTKLGGITMTGCFSRGRAAGIAPT